MSAFANGSGDGTQSMSSALASGNDLTAGTSIDPTAGTAGMGNAFTIGNGMPDSNRYAFQLPPDIANAIRTDQTMSPMAGLSGVQSGMTMPDYANATTGSGTYGSNNNINLGGLQAAGGKIQSALQNQQKLQGGSGRVSTRAENFGAPVIALPMASGSTAGNSLLQMMQRYQPGNVVGYTPSSSGYGMR